jgi:hypothetical protein
LSVSQGGEQIGRRYLNLLQSEGKWSIVSTAKECGTGRTTRERYVLPKHDYLAQQLGPTSRKNSLKHRVFGDCSTVLAGYSAVCDSSVEHALHAGQPSALDADDQCW